MVTEIVAFSLTIALTAGSDWAVSVHDGLVEGDEEDGCSCGGCPSVKLKGSALASFQVQP